MPLTPSRSTERLVLWLRLCALTFVASLILLGILLVTPLIVMQFIGW